MTTFCMVLIYACQSIARTIWLFAPISIRRSGLGWREWNISVGERERELWRGGSLTCNLRRSKWRRKRSRRRRTTSAGLGPASVRTRDQIKMWHHSILVPHILVIFQPAHLHTVSSFITTNIIRTQVREWTYLNSIGQVICGHGFRDVTRCSSWCAGLF